MECPGQGKDYRSIIEIVVEKQLQAGYTVSPSGACFTSPFFLIAASLHPRKRASSEKSDRGNAQVTKIAAASETRTRGCGAPGPKVAVEFGIQLDGNSGFYYNRARWYDGRVGRFTAIDPYDGDPQSPISLHRYLYANGSPISFRDPTGQFGISDVMLAVTITGILINIGTATYDSFKYLTATDPLEKNVHFALFLVDLAGLAEGPGGTFTGGARLAATIGGNLGVMVAATNTVRGVGGLIANDGFDKMANDIASYMQGANDGSELPQTVKDVLKAKKGSIKNAPLGPVNK